MSVDCPGPEKKATLNASHPPEGQGHRTQAEREVPLRARLKPLAHALMLMLAAGGSMQAAQAQQALGAAWFASKGANQNAAATTGRLLNGQAASSLNPSPDQQRINAQVQRSIGNLASAAQAVAAQQAAQSAARQAALNGNAGVPDGLAEGGLKVDTNSLTAGWTNANAPVQTGAEGKAHVAIRQTADKAILNWETFNVGKNTVVQFQQQPDWAVLNRVNDPQARPSQVRGQIKADGTVMLVNRNGIVFSGSSQVNTRSLVASALDFYGGADIEDGQPAGMSAAQWAKAKTAARDKVFSDGLLSRPPLPGMAGSGGNYPLTFSDGTNLNEITDRAKRGEVYAKGDGVTVEAGAQISTGRYGQALLVGHNVVNEGTVSAPDGQVLMAAGRAMSLSAGTTRYERGELSDTPIRGYAITVDRGGQVTNSGLLQATRGNVTLRGANIAQDGVLAVTHGAEAQGSIILSAYSGSLGSVAGYRTAWTTGLMVGDVHFGSGSLSAILPDDSGQKVTGNPYKPSDVEVYGYQILLKDGARVYAPGGAVKFTTEPTGWPFADFTQSNTSRIYLGRGAVVDVAGLAGVELPMERNALQGELRANELRDNPVLRDSSLRGSKVFFDPRRAGKLLDGSGIADLSGYLGLIQRDVNEFMTTGGTISMSAAEIIARQGSVIDLSGGSVRYLDGFTRSTQLIGPGGQRIGIEQASAYVPYTLAGQFVSSHRRWGVSTTYASPMFGSQPHFEAGYDEGRAAGSLVIELSNRADNGGGTRQHYPDMVRLFEGEVRADVVRGRQQVDAPKGAGVTDVTRAWRERPAAAQLWFHTRRGLTDPVADPFGGNITIADRAPLLGDGFQFDSALFDYAKGAASLVDGIVAHEHVLPASFFDGHTFGTVRLSSGRTSDPRVSFDADGKQQVAFPTGPAGILTVGQGVTMNLGDYGSLAFTGRQSRIDGTIRAPGGSVHIENLVAPLLGAAGTDNNWDDIPQPMRPTFHLGATGVIDTAGRWSNDFADVRAGKLPQPPVLNGGTVELVGHNILLDKGSLIDVGGGGRLGVDGKTLTVGNGGAILLDNGTPFMNAVPTSASRRKAGWK